VPWASAIFDHPLFKLKENSRKEEPERRTGSNSTYVKVPPLRGKWPRGRGTSEIESRAIPCGFGHGQFIDSTTLASGALFPDGRSWLERVKDASAAEAHPGRCASPMLKIKNARPLRPTNSCPCQWQDLRVGRSTSRAQNAWGAKDRHFLRERDSRLVDDRKEFAAFYTPGVGYPRWQQRGSLSEPLLKRTYSAVSVIDYADILLSSNDAATE